MSESSSIPQPPSSQLNENVFQRRRRNLQTNQFVVLRLQVFHQCHNRRRRLLAVQHIHIIQLPRVHHSIQILQHAVQRRFRQPYLNPRRIRRTFLQLTRRPGCNHFSVIHNRHAIAKLLRFFNVVRRQHDRFLLALQLLNNVVNFPPHLWIQSRRRLIQKQHPGIIHQRHRQGQPLVNDPRVLFLDEPTAGLDPQVRREIYDIIEELKREKKTIVLTTHYIEEAEKLCDRVAIVDHGKVIATGTPRDLKAHSGGTTRIEVRLSKPASNGALGTLEGAVDAREVGGTYVIHSERPPQTIVALVKHLEAEGNELVSLEIASPSLEDVFIEMTGRRLRD